MLISDQVSTCGRYTAVKILCDRD